MFGILKIFFRLDINLKWLVFWKYLCHIWFVQWELSPTCHCCDDLDKNSANLRKVIFSSLCRFWRQYFKMAGEGWVFVQNAGWIEDQCHICDVQLQHRRWHKCSISATQVLQECNISAAMQCGSVAAQKATQVQHVVQYLQKNQLRFHCKPSTALTSNFTALHSQSWLQGALWGLAF